MRDRMVRAEAGLAVLHEPTGTSFMDSFVFPPAAASRLCGLRLLSYSPWYPARRPARPASKSAADPTIAGILEVDF